MLTFLYIYYRFSWIFDIFINEDITTFFNPHLLGIMITVNLIGNIIHRPRKRNIIDIMLYN